MAELCREIIPLRVEVWGLYLFWFHGAWMLAD